MVLEFKSVARRSLHSSGALSAWHRLRHGDTLTVVLFHRVLPEGARDWRWADPVYTLSAGEFRLCLDFFRRHYDVVDLADLLASRSDARLLPRRALLITFDDGWADSLDTAAPILEEFGLPATLFAATEALRHEGHMWWQERAAILDRTARPVELPPCRVGETMTAGQLPAITEHMELLFRLRGLDDGEREHLLARAMGADQPPRDKRQMLSPEGLRSWKARGFTVASHGAEHMPLTVLTDDEIRRDLERSRDDIRRMIDDTEVAPVTALSFPHGRYDGNVVRLARRAGFELLFTSDPCVNALEEGRRCPALLGRIAIDGRALREADGRLRPERLATWLFTRPKRRLHA